MARSHTTKDLIQAVRSLLDEDNTAALSDLRDIVPALNRGLNKAYSVLARHYPEPLLTSITVPIEVGKTTYEIPEDAFEDRVEKIEIIQQNSYYPIKQVAFRDLAPYETSGATNIPAVWASIGRTYQIAPATTTASSARVWYLKEPPSLGVEQGRITLINKQENYLVLDQAGESLSSSIDENTSFVSIIDKDTGVVKSSHQISNIIGNRLVLATSPNPNKTKVYGETISGVIAEAAEVDDYICFAGQSCISPLRNPLANYVTQFAVAELVRKLGGEADMEQRVLKDMEKDVERQWAGRESTIRVKANSLYWGTRTLTGG